jgi:tetratricopeptide (TPR) repeat protein
MFRYPQTWGARGLILNFPPPVNYSLTPLDDSARAMYNSDLFFEMGNINAALLHAFDHMVLYGRTYDNVKRMAECSMVKGEYALAMKFLTMLERTLYHRAYAREYKALLADPKARELHFAEQRSRLPTVDLPLGGASFIPLLSLLKSNPHDRMAFDYLMAWSLLDRQSLPMLAENAGGLKDAGYDYIPARVQEGLLALEQMSGHPAAPAGFHCDEGTTGRFNAFTEQMQLYPSKPAAQRALFPGFSDTFMYYAQFVAPQPAVNYARDYLAAADEFRVLGLTTDAIAQYQDALRLDPGLAEAHAALAKILRSQGRLEEAEFHEREARRPRTGAPEPAMSLQPGGSSWRE